MDRRRFLKGAGLTSLGFGSYVGGNRLVGSSVPAVSLSGTVRGDVALSIGGRVDQQFTDSHPATIRFSVTNTGERAVQCFYESGDADISAPARPVTELVADHETGSTELLVIPDDREQFSPVVEPVPVTKGLTDCWHPRTTRWGQNDIVLGDRIDPGESVDGCYTLLHHATLRDRLAPGSCLDTGSYQIRQPVAVAEPSETDGGPSTYRERSVRFDYRIGLS